VTRAAADFGQLFPFIRWRTDGGGRLGIPKKPGRASRYAKGDWQSCQKHKQYGLKRKIHLTRQNDMIATGAFTSIVLRALHHPVEQALPLQCGHRLVQGHKS
jgi:hypothetical protein